MMFLCLWLRLGLQFNSKGRVRSVKNATLVGGNHVLDVDESVFTTVPLHFFERLLDNVAQIVALTLTVVKLVSRILVAMLQ